MNSLVLAYIGDAYFELLVREHLISKGILKVNELQTESIKFSSAQSQRKLLEKIKEHLTDEEINIVKTARNNKKTNHPKNTNIITYKHSTAFEALIGYLYLNNDIERIKYIFNIITEL